MTDPITAEIKRLIKEELDKQKPRLFPQLESVPPFRMYSLKNAADILDVSVDYVEARVKDGSIKSLIDLGSTRSKYRIRADELQRFIDDRTVLSSLDKTGRI